MQDRDRLRASVCRSKYLLNAVASGERIDIADLRLVDKARGKWEPATPKAQARFKWLWELENGVQLYFVPVSYIPGSASQE